MKDWRALMKGMWRSTEMKCETNTVAPALHLTKCGWACWPFGINFIMSLGIMYSICGRKQETDKEFTDKRCSLVEKKSK
jgi:hypothetical protein